MKTLFNKYIILCTVCFALSFSSGMQAQSFIHGIDHETAMPEVCPDSLMTRIVMRQSEHDPHRYPSFRRMTRELDSLLSVSPEKIAGVYVYGATSPDGLWQNNVDLCRLRTISAVSYIKACTGVPARMVHSLSLNEDWDGLYRMVEISDLPYRNEVMLIIRTKSWGERKRALMDLDGGKVWRILLDEFFPALRGVKVGIICRSDDEPEDAPETVAATAGSVEIIEDSVEETVEATATPEVQEILEPEDVAVYEPAPAGRNPWWAAIKTDVASDALAYPQAGVETQLGRHLSLEVMGWYAMMSYIHPCSDHKVYGFRPELRFWTKDAMTKGFFFGLHGEAVWYAMMTTGKDLYQNADLCRNPESCGRRHFFDARFDLDNDGIKETHNYYHDTPTIAAGVTAGYSVALDRKNHWGLEFLAGFGYIHTSYNHFRRGNPWEIMTPAAPLVKDYFGITRVSVNLSYRFSLR